MLSWTISAPVIPAWAICDDSIFDKIKIDQSFMQALDKDDHEVEKVVSTIVVPGGSLNMQVTVEGVETGPQADFVRGLSADQAQRFFFGRPVPAAEIAGNLLKD